MSVRTITGEERAVDRSVPTAGDLQQNLSQGDRSAAPAVTNQRRRHAIFELQVREDDLQDLEGIV